MGLYFGVVLQNMNKDTNEILSPLFLNFLLPSVVIPRQRICLLVFISQKKKKKKTKNWSLIFWSGIALFIYILKSVHEECVYRFSN